MECAVYGNSNSMINYVTIWIDLYVDRFGKNQTRCIWIRDAQWKPKTAKI